MTMQKFDIHEHHIYLLASKSGRWSLWGISITFFTCNQMSNFNASLKWRGHFSCNDGNQRLKSSSNVDRMNELIKLHTPENSSGLHLFSLKIYWWTDHSITLESRSWLSGGCFCRLWGKITVNNSGLSALKAPRMTAALVPEAPEVYIWFFWSTKDNIISTL